MATTMPTKADLLTGTTAGKFSAAIGALYDVVEENQTGVAAALPKTGGTLTGALHQPNPVSITSSSGALTLTEAGNSFIAAGTEAITSIAGWTAGIAIIRWNTARTLTHNATSLILQGAANRITAVGDVGIYEMTSAGAREIGYFPIAKTPEKILQTVIVTSTGSTAPGSGGFIEVTNTGSTITPKSTGSKIKITASWNGYSTSVPSYNSYYWSKIVRTAPTTADITGTLSGAAVSSTGGLGWSGRIVYVGYDSPNTTSQIRYAIQHVPSISTGTVTTSEITIILQEVEV